MKILFAPFNIASMPAVTCAAMNKIDGIRAVYLSTDSHPYITENQYRKSICSPVKYVPFKKDPLGNIWFRLYFNFLFRPYRFVKFMRWLLWADIVHWTGESIFHFNIDLFLIRFLRKKRFIEWVGSDMRIPEVTMKESPWYKKIFNKGYEYSAAESKENSYRTQEKFARYGFNPVLVPEMHLYLKPGLFKKAFLTQYRIFEPQKFKEVYYPVAENKKIIIVHSPSAKFAKGSDYIAASVMELQKKYDIEFILLHKVSRETVLETMKKCDIFIDQIILGSYAAAAIEAMSWGKPAVAYIMPSVYGQGIPEDCPIVNANPDNLTEKLTALLENPALRHDIGIKSRAYAATFHNADLLAKDLLNTYRSYLA